MTPRPRSTSWRPASNCGFTRSTIGAPGWHSPTSTGITSRNEMNDRSPTTTSTAPPIWSTSTCRTLTRSRLVTRGSARNRSWSWPCPTSSATTWAAPRWSRQSVNPARRGADVERSPARRRRAEDVERVIELHRAAPDEPWRRARRSPRRQRARPGEPPCRRPTPLTSTRLAAMSACASVRLAVSSRRTSSASSRRRGPTEISRTRRARGSRAFLAGAFFLAGGLLGRSLLLRRGLLRPEPSSWPGPSWPEPSSWPGPSWREPSWPGCVITSALTRSAIFVGELLEAILEFVEALREPVHLLGDLALHVRDPVGGLTTSIEQCLHGLLGVAAPDLAGFDERLHDRLGLLARDVGELGTCVDETLNCWFCHDHRLLAAGQRIEPSGRPRRDRRTSRSTGDRRRRSATAPLRHPGANERESTAETLGEQPVGLRPVADHQHAVPDRTASDVATIGSTASPAADAACRR